MRVQEALFFFNHRETKKKKVKILDIGLIMRTDFNHVLSGVCV